MSAKQIKQMVLPEELLGKSLMGLGLVPSGSFIIFFAKERKIFLVIAREDCFTFYPVLTDGTISRKEAKPALDTRIRSTWVWLYLAQQIPDLQITPDDKIVWAK